MKLKDLLSVAYFDEIIVKYKENEFNELKFTLDKGMSKNILNIFAQEFLNSEVERVGAKDEYTLSVVIKEKQNDTY